MTTAAKEYAPVQIIDRRDVHQAIDALTDSALEKLAHYIDFLRYEERMEELEDEEDIAFIKSLTPEDYANAVPFEEVVHEFEEKHGPLYQN
jgi:DNA polymerase III epsilon subunit-like protein